MPELFLNVRQLNRALLARQLLLERSGLPLVKAIEQDLHAKAQLDEFNWDVELTLRGVASSSRLRLGSRVIEGSSEEAGEASDEIGTRLIPRDPQTPRPQTAHAPSP